jgi:hypothetical protein
MRVLHVTFENFQDVPGILSRSHSYCGDEGTLITLTPSRLGFPNGICLNYPLLNSDFIRLLRKMCGRDNVNVPERELSLKIKGSKQYERLFLRSRDMLWLYKAKTAWCKYGLGEFDVYHFDGDMPFMYGDRILKRLKNKRIVTHFFGSELRKWGRNPYLKERADLSITSELDHTKIDSTLVFVPIPYIAGSITPRVRENRVLRVGHSPTRKSAKGTPDIIEAIQRLQKDIAFEFLLIEGVSHKKCMELKMTCDIGIDQIGNYAGTGYGRSGLEFLALGIPTITEIPDEYEPLLGNHPFVKATKKNFKDVLYCLLTDEKLRHEKRRHGITWVNDFPHPRRIIDQIYSEYKKRGWR